MGSWIARRRNQLEISQSDLVARLTINGYEVSRPTVSNWENGKVPPLDDPTFVRAIANALKMSVLDVLIVAGYPLTSDSHTEDGRRAADIVDQLPEDKRRLALGVLEQILQNN